jgi:hypothetical protein
VALLPDGLDGHFGPELRRFVLMQYHQGQSTLPRLVALLQSVGVSVSKRQVQRLLTDKQEDFVSEARDVLRATETPCVNVSGIWRIADGRQMESPGPLLNGVP